MKICLPVVICLLIFSCKSNNKDTNQKDSWILSERRIYKNILNKEGLLDTAYVTNYLYKEGTLNDSLQGYIVYAYNEARPQTIEYFQIGKDHKPHSTGASVYKYDGKGTLLSFTKTSLGVLESQENYVYDTAGRESSFKSIVRRSEDAGNFDDNPFNQKINSNATYDTFNVNYEYNSQNKISKAFTTDLKKQIIRTDINLFTGNEPLVSYSVDNKKDTVQKIDYSKEGNAEKMVIHSGNLVITRWTYKSWLMGLVVDDTKAKTRRKLLNKYDISGRMVEQKVYLAKY